MKNIIYNINANILISLSFVLFFCGCSKNSEQTKNPMKLWYEKPAEIWEEAVPIGNGRLGAMVFGSINKETIQLNEETVWAGEPGNNILPEIKQHLPKIRKLIFEGKHTEAQKLANKYFSRHAGENPNLFFQTPKVKRLL